MKVGNEGESINDPCKVLVDSAFNIYGYYLFDFFGWTLDISLDVTYPFQETKGVILLFHYIVVARVEKQVSKLRIAKCWQFILFAFT